jgi:hypothetical protein
VGKGLNGGDDDLFAGFQGVGQFAAAAHGGHHAFYVGILFDGVSDLPVEDHPVGDHHDGVEDGFVGVKAG